jgi:hypothetical protein
MTGRYPFRYGLQTAVILVRLPTAWTPTSTCSRRCSRMRATRPPSSASGTSATRDQKILAKQRGFDYQYGAMIGELDYFTHSDAGVMDWFRNNEPVKEEGYTTLLIGNDA